MMIVLAIEKWRHYLLALCCIYLSKGLVSYPIADGDFIEDSEMDDEIDHI